MGNPECGTFRRAPGVSISRRSGHGLGFAASPAVVREVLQRVICVVKAGTAFLLTCCLLAKFYKITAL